MAVGLATADCGSEHRPGTCRKVDLKPHEVLTEVFIPATRRYEYVKEWKQAHRRDDDIAIVNAGMRVTFRQGPSGALHTTLYYRLSVIA